MGSGASGAVMKTECVQAGLGAAIREVQAAELASILESLSEEDRIRLVATLNDLRTPRSPLAHAEDAPQAAEEKDATPPAVEAAWLQRTSRRREELRMERFDATAQELQSPDVAEMEEDAEVLSAQIVSLESDNTEAATKEKERLSLELQEIQHLIVNAKRTKEDIAEVYKLSASEFAAFKTIFKACDIHQSGTVEAVGLQKVMKTLGEDYSIEQMGDALKRFAVDSDGKLGFAEFVKVLLPMYQTVLQEDVMMCKSFNLEVIQGSSSSSSSTPLPREEIRVTGAI